MKDEKKLKKFKSIARESMVELLDTANERNIQPKDIVQIVSKGNTFFLVYAE